MHEELASGKAHTWEVPKMSNKHNLGTSNDDQANPRAAFDTRQSPLLSIPFSMGGVEAKASTDADIPVTSTEVTGEAAISVQQSAGKVAMTVDSDTATNSTTGDSNVVLPGVTESTQQPQTEVVAPQPRPAKVKGKRSSKSKVAAATSSAGTTQASEEITNPGIFDSLIRLLFSGYLIYAMGQLMTYTEGRWVALHTKLVALPAIARHFGYTKKIGDIKEILGQLMLRCAVAAFPPPKPNLICLNNGTLNPLTGQLQAHNPDFYLRHKVDITWDADAACPRFERFLDEIFRDDSDKALKIRLVQQWFGYCLIPFTDMQKMLMLIGDGENGKSVLLKILAQIVGRENTSNIQVERFGKADVRAELEGKLLNISPELSDRAWQHSVYLMAIVVGDEIEVKRLYQDSFSFKPTARLVVSTNNLPRVYDHSHGFFRRVMMLTFNRRFTDADRDRQLEAALMAELPGILAWAVRGLQELVRDGQFVIPASSEAAKNRYRIDSDDARLFLEERFEFDPAGAGMTVAIVYTDYCKWCGESGLPAMNKFTFGKRFRLAGVDHRHTRTGDVWLVRSKGEHEAEAQGPVPETSPEALEPVTAREVAMAT